jgi:hypothetical protein
MKIKQTSNKPKFYYSIVDSYSSCYSLFNSLFDALARSEWMSSKNSTSSYEIVKIEDYSPDYTGPVAKAYVDESYYVYIVRMKVL